MTREKPNPKPTQEDDPCDDWSKAPLGRITHHG